MAIRAHTKAFIFLRVAALAGHAPLTELDFRVEIGKGDIAMAVIGILDLHTMEASHRIQAAMAVNAELGCVLVETDLLVPDTPDFVFNHSRVTDGLEICGITGARDSGYVALTTEIDEAGILCEEVAFGVGPGVARSAR
jgi:hypothetical protein